MEISEQVLVFGPYRESFQGRDSYSCEKVGKAAIALGSVCDVPRPGYDVGIVLLRGDGIAYIAVWGESSVHGYILPQREGQDHIIEVERIVHGFHSSCLGIVPVPLADAEIGHERLFLPGGDRSWVQVVHCPFVPGGYSYPSHRHVIGGSLLGDVSYSEH